MGWEAWFTLAVVLAILAALIGEKVAPGAAMTAGMVVVLVAGIVDADQALAGFSSAAPITVAALYVLARAVEKTGALTPLVRATLGDRGGTRRTLARLVFPTAGISAFLNNTPIVAMLMPEVTAWAESHRRSPSTYLMPLSFAALMGGVMTVIGTSTNIVVDGLMREADAGPMGFFEIGAIGLPVALLGTVLMIAIAPKVLPARRSARQEVAEQTRQFVVDMTVDLGGALDGRPVSEAGLRHLTGVFLAALERGGELLAPVAPETVLRGGDRLQFVGRADEVVDLQSKRGLTAVASSHLLDLDGGRARYFEAVVGADSPLVGTTLKEAGFRAAYQAAVLAVHRSGQRVDAKLGDVRLRVGDTLLLMGDPMWRERWRDRNDFLAISVHGAMAPVAGKKAITVGLITLGIVLVAALDVIPILQASLVGAVILVLGRVVTPGEARNAVDLDVIVTIAASFGVAAAVHQSGLAGTIAAGLVDVFSSWGPRGVLAGVVVATVVLTGLISNNAAAALMFPIAIETASSAGLQPRGFFIAIAVAASTDFLTPIGYQTNTMVYGPGGYRFSDYPRLGGALTLLVMTTTVVLVPVFWPLG